MLTATFDSNDDADFVLFDLITQAGDAIPLRLLVDSGFFGTSAMVLASHWQRWNWGDESPATAAGALQGTQQRGWVVCRIGHLQWEEALIAIFADPAPLALPASVDGLVGLSFLRLFDAWGAARTDDRWQFSLSLHGGS